MAKKDKSSIYVDAQSLLYLLYDAQFEMDKKDRAVLAVRLLNHTESILSHFALAYNTERKVENIEKMMAHFEVVKIESRFAIEVGMLKKPHTINRLRELIVKLDEGIVRWRNYVISARQDLHTGDAGSNG